MPSSGLKVSDTEEKVKCPLEKHQKILNFCADLLLPMISFGSSEFLCVCIVSLSMHLSFIIYLLLI
jgi:hypothetical protein